MVLWCGEGVRLVMGLWRCPFLTPFRHEIRWCFGVANGFVFCMVSWQWQQRQWQWQWQRQQQQLEQKIGVGRGFIFCMVSWQWQQQQLE